MKLVTFKHSGITKPGVMSLDHSRIFALSDVLGLPSEVCMTQFIAQRTEGEMQKLAEAAKNGGFPSVSTDEAEILSPITRPIHDILCVGVNYASHREETERGLKDEKLKHTEKSIYFSKRACNIIGPGAALKGRFDLDTELDYEVELAVIIGKECRDLKPEEVEDVIFGYSIFNDFSSRKIQREHKQWLRGKSLDTYSSMGPAILTKDELPFPVEVDVISKVNGQERQHSNTRLLLNDLTGIICDLSAGITLEPGDIIATGTPAGVAMGMIPPQFLKAGDEVICEIPPIGQLINTIEQ